MLTLEIPMTGILVFWCVSIPIIIAASEDYPTFEACRNAAQAHYKAKRSSCTLKHQNVRRPK